MINERLLVTPLDDYTLVDFGNGRKLERFADYLVDRPAPQATSLPRLTDWQADWFYSGDRVGGGKWIARRAGLPEDWVIRLEEQTMHCRLAQGGQVGIYPEHVICWRWVRQRLQGCSHIRDLQVLNLFGGTGGTSVAASMTGASVTHVDAQAAQIELARKNVAQQGVRWIREDVMTFVERAIRRKDQYHMIIMDPPSFGRGPKGRVWDIEVDLDALMKQLPRLIVPNCCGLWLSVHTPAYSASSLEQMFREVLPGGNVQAISLHIQSQDGRNLSAGVAAIWYDDE